MRRRVPPAAHFAHKAGRLVLEMLPKPSLHFRLNQHTIARLCRVAAEKQLCGCTARCSSILGHSARLCLAKIPSGIEIIQFHSLLAGFDFDPGTSKNVQE